VGPPIVAFSSPNLGPFVMIDLQHFAMRSSQLDLGDQMHKLLLLQARNPRTLNWTVEIMLWKVTWRMKPFLRWQKNLRKGQSPTPEMWPPVWWLPGERPGPTSTPYHNFTTSPHTHTHTHTHTPTFYLYIACSSHKKFTNPWIYSRDLPRWVSARRLINYA
jgi:hypothetical protein